MVAFVSFKRLRTFLFISMLSSNASQAFAFCSISDFPVPSDMDLSMLLPGTVHNGRWMQAWGFRSQDSVEEIADYYFKRLEKISRSTFNGIWQLSYMDGSCFYTVQLPPSDGFKGDTFGRIVLTWEAQGVAQTAPPTDWLPNEHVLILDSLMDEPGKKGRVVYANILMATDELHAYYVSAFAKEGFTLNDEFTIDAARSLVFEGRGERRVVQIVPGPDVAHVLIVSERFGR